MITTLRWTALLGATIIINVGSQLAMIAAVAAEEFLPTWLPAMTPTLASLTPGP